MAETPRILLVDDAHELVQLMRLRLEAAGYAVVPVYDGQQALDHVRQAGPRPDLIILDLMLPKLNGYEVCTMLKQDTRYQQIPIILFTAKAQAKDEQLGLECGANAYVRKPFRADELLEKIHTLLVASHRAGEMSP